MATTSETTMHAARDHSDAIDLPGACLASWSLCWRELIRFFRQRNRVIGAVGQPILFWLLFGVGLEQTFRTNAAGQGGQTFQQYYVPGTLVLILLFTSIFTTISIIEDRKEGFLQSVLVAPIPRWAMVWGKVLGGTLIGLFQGLVFLTLSLAVQRTMPSWDTLQLVALLFVSALGLTAMGFVLAWRMESTQGFHAIMSVLLMPMWLLSGAFFPIPILSSSASVLQIGMHWLMRLNPMTYAVAGARQLMFSGPENAGLELPSLWVCWLVTGLFAVVAFLAAGQIAKYRVTGDLL